MSRLTTKTLDRIEERIRGVEEGSLRYSILQSVKKFKTSWMELGQSLYAVWKDKMFKQWGYMTFDAYTTKEIGIRKQTALKLLKSYYFLEKEEPSYLKKEYVDESAASKLPSYESVNVLRLAKNKKEISDGDYSRLKKEVFEMGKNDRDVKKDLTGLIRQREELDPDEARQKRRVAAVRRLLGTLRSLKNELETARMVPANILKETSSLISKIEEEMHG